MQYQVYIFKIMSNFLYTHTEIVIYFVCYLFLIEIFQLLSLDINFIFQERLCQIVDSLLAIKMNQLHLLMRVSPVACSLPYSPRYGFVYLCYI